jgi:phosphomevalonate kinase
VKVAAPGKLLLTGQYAVLEGAPALVMAVDRLAVADDAEHDAAPTQEVAAAFAGASPPRVDVSALYDGDRKLGLGSSAAALVAALGVRGARRGEDLAAPDVRARMVEEARAVHRACQGGGSGVDIAAAVHGGTLCFEQTRVRPVPLPTGLVLVAFWSGVPARTSELVAEVNAARGKDGAGWARAMDRLGAASSTCGRAVGEDVAAFLRALSGFASALEGFADATGVAVFPRPWRELGALAREHESVFIPSGAGGGDFGVLYGTVPPAEAWLERASALGFTSVRLNQDARGVRVLS